MTALAATPAALQVLEVVHRHPGSPGLDLEQIYLHLDSAVAMATVIYCLADLLNEGYLRNVAVQPGKKRVPRRYSADGCKSLSQYRRAYGLPDICAPTPTKRAKYVGIKAAPSTWRQECAEKDRKDRTRGYTGADLLRACETRPGATEHRNYPSLYGAERHPYWFNPVVAKG